MEVEDDHVGSDDEIDDSKHANLIEKVLSLDKVQHIKKPCRSEPTIHISEYDLVKSTTGNKESIHIHALTKALKQRSSHVELAKKLRNTEKKSKTLEKPLEKPQAERIRRTIGYTNTKRELDRWEPIVMSNRAAPHLTFPLNTDLEVRTDTSTLNCQWRVKTDLQKELEKFENKTEEYIIEPEERFPLTLEEVMERRRETAKLRAVQSYKEAKARRQNKIKSKKFHRIQRREKMKQQIKEFELLQKTNPEEALKKLEEIEKARAEERVSLRHRSTGQWARNKQVRAKYDKESRQVLAQQLTISRELTQKLNPDKDSESEEEQSIENKTSNSDNPWVNGIKTSEEVDNFVKSYRKYWDEKSKQLEKEETNDQNSKGTSSNECQTKEGEETNVQIEDSKTKDSEETNATQMPIDSSEENDSQKTKVTINKTKDSNKTIAAPLQVDSSKEIVGSKTKERVNSKSKHEAKKNGVRSKAIQRAKSKNAPKLKRSSLSTSDWIVSDINDKSTIDNVFDVLEKNLADKIQKKAQSVLNSEKAKVKKPKKLKKNELTKKKIDLSLHSQTKRPIIDEEMDENTKTVHENNHDKVEVDKLEKILNSIESNNNKSNDIDPTDVIKVKTVSLNNQLPDLLTTDDNEENSDKMAGISEAFEDDDIIEEFDKEKADEIKKDAPKDVDLTLPGWGEWGGKDLKVSKRKKKRFILKFPKKLPRKDDNKKKLIIKEDANVKIKEHLVSEIPFPFQTVKDFEASIRAPIGNTFVPETAFRKMIKPPVITKMGTIIDPMSQDVLLNIKK